jgi:hypothetical protein
METDNFLKQFSNVTTTIFDTIFGDSKGLRRIGVRCFPSQDAQQHFFKSNEQLTCSFQFWVIWIELLQIM